MKKSLLIYFFSLYAYLSLGQGITKTMKRLPDTGQNTSYTSTFGEDNDYTINAPFFYNNGNGTITDTITGLMWQQTDGGEMTFENASIYCDSLKLGGYTNWRLPNAHEAFSILNHQNSNPAVNISVFTKTAAEYWWTKDRQANDDSKVWCTNAGGGIGNHPKSETISAGGTKKFHARAVRDVSMPTSASNHFTKNNNGTITDNLTGLIWQQIPNANLFTWETAITYTENLSFAGEIDWRLPNIKELQSLNDEGLVSPSINTTYFGTIDIKKYWSSTSLPNQSTKAWYFDTQFGITTYDLKTNTNYIICVRGGNKLSTSISTITKFAPTSVFPNPVSNDLFFNLEILNPNLLKFEIFNQIGEVILIQSPVITNNQVHFNTESLVNGLYYLFVKKDNNNIVYKFSIQK